MMRYRGVQFNKNDLLRCRNRIGHTLLPLRATPHLPSREVRVRSAAQRFDVPPCRGRDPKFSFSLQTI